MIHIEDSVIVDEILAHVGEQRVRAKLVDKPFELGVLTDKKPSQVLSIVHAQANEDILKEIGMSKYQWRDDALRSELRLAGEQLIISICSPR